MAECNCGEAHKGHICVLKSNGLMKEVAHLTDNPTVVCFSCGTEANAAENVCEPMPM